MKTHPWIKSPEPLHKQYIPMALGALIVWMMLVAFVSFCNADDNYTDNQIVDAIYKAEGGNKAQYSYGIRSVSCKNMQECRQVCKNTVKNNRKRYLEYGYKKYNT